MKHLRDLFIIVCFSGVLLWNAQDFPGSHFRAPFAVQTFVWAMHLDQSWRMFVTPLPAGGWFVVPGRLSDGTEIDLLKGTPLNWSKPAKVYQFRTEIWRKYLFRIGLFHISSNKNTTRQFARYLCRSWNAAHKADKRLLSLDIVYVLSGPGRGEAGVRQQILHHDCEMKMIGKK